MCLNTILLKDILYEKTSSLLIQYVSTDHIIMMERTMSCSKPRPILSREHCLQFTECHALVDATLVRGQEFAKVLRVSTKIR